MYAELLPLLRCPTCTHPLRLREPLQTNDEIIGGTLQCTACQRTAPIRGGVPDFLGSAQPATPAQVVNEWPLTAWAYERVWRPFALTLLSQERFPYRRELPLITTLAGATRGGLQIDIACSAGLYARAMARVAHAVPRCTVGIDHSMAFCREARAHAQRAGLRISYVRASAQALPFAAHAAHSVVIGGSLNEIGDRIQALGQVARVLALDGRYASMSLVAAATPLGRMTQRAFGRGGVVFPSVATLRADHERAGLHIHATQTYNIVTFLGASPQ